VQLIMQKARKIAVYDPDPEVITELHRNISAEWPIEAHVHDIFSGPLPKRHDSIYCLDAIDHVTRSEEDVFVRHLRDSLSYNHDILVVGSSSLVPHAPAPPREYATLMATSRPTFVDPSAPGQPADLVPICDTSQWASRFHPRTAEDLKALLERYFHVVFMFSMVDDIVHPGIIHTADYALATCCGRKP
jgi:hypothetical protein